MRSFVAGTAGAFGARLVPRILGRLAAGRCAVEFRTGLRSASNSKATRET